MLLIQLQGVINRKVVNVTLVVSCLQWNKLETLESWSSSSHQTWKRCAWWRRNRQGTWVIEASLSFDPKLLQVFHPGKKQEPLCLDERKSKSWLPFLRPLPVCLWGDKGCKNWGPKEESLYLGLQTPLVYIGYFVWNLPWSRWVFWVQADAGHLNLNSSSLVGWKRPIQRVGDPKSERHLLPKGTFPTEDEVFASFSFLLKSYILCSS